MPSRAYRRRDLHDHLVRATPGTSVGDYYDPARRTACEAHPDWPRCLAGCGWPVDPAAGTTHPGCETA